MWDTILQILQWAIPSGGIGAAIAWIANREVRQAKTAKEVHNAYKELYEDVNANLIKMRDENEKLYKSITRLERAIQRATVCRFWNDCPIRGELPEYKGRGTYNGPVRQRPRGQYHIRDQHPDDRARTGCGGQCDDGGHDGPVGLPAGGCELHSTPWTGDGEPDQAGRPDRGQGPLGQYDPGEDHL